MAITKVGESQSFAYTGGIQTFTVPFTGLYKLYLVGATGRYHANAVRNVGAGGVTTQYLELKKGTTLYVVVGGLGTTINKDVQYGGCSTTGGYNGGGGFTHNGGWNANIYTGSGGGATHIATRTGLLSSLSNYRDTVLAVAGGGGGAFYVDDYYGGDSWIRLGGGGGGLTSQGTYPATQSSGYAFGQGGELSGGGWFGGKPAGENLTNSGGSGYLSNSNTYTINGVSYKSTTTTGGQTTTTKSGSATITYIAKSFPTITVDGVTIDKLVFDGVSVEAVIFNGTTLS